ncbi:MAG: mechanosensitive ion channel family protein [bacterium]|nr:mechanosensitive ion channel family protein [bacterium]
MQNFFQNFSADAIVWLSNNGIKIVGIIILAYIVRKFSRMVIEKFIRKIVTPGRHVSKEAERKREDTLIQIIATSFGIVIWVMAFFLILQEIGIDIAPFLAAAGIVGLALGFGGQYLIRDLISGLFIIMENQYRIGDIVSLNDKTGAVEDISMRMTTLRDLDGTVHHVPHGDIKTVSNLSKDFARVNLNIGVSYNSKLEKVISVVNKIGDDLAKDPEWKDQIIKAPQFLRVDDFADSAIVIKILGDTQPLMQWGVAGELRKRLKIAFDKEAIEIPFPQRVIHQSRS